MDEKNCIYVALVCFIALFIIPLLGLLVYIIFNRKARNKLWTKIKSGFKGFKSAFSVVLLVLLSLVLSLSLSLPASAYTFSNAKKIPISGVQFTAPAIRANQLIYNGSNSSIQFDTVTTGAQSWIYTSLFFQLNFNQTIPANSLVSVSMSVSHSNPNDAPVCFSGDFGQQLVFCDISGDNQNYTITGLFFYTNAYSNLKLYSYTSNANITLGTPTISVGPVVASTVNEEGLSSAELQGLITQIDYVVQNTDVTRNGVRQQLNDIDSDIDGLSTQLGYIVDNTDVTRNGVRQQLDDIATALDDIISSSDRQWQQEQQDRQDYQDAVDDSQTGAEDAGADVDSASSTIVGNMSSIIGAIINSPSTDCIVSVTAGDSGVLQINNINLCQAPPEILNLVHVISSIVVTLAVLWTAYSLFNAVIGIFEVIQGGKLNG